MKAAAPGLVFERFQLLLRAFQKQRVEKLRNSSTAIERGHIMSSITRGAILFVGSVTPGYLVGLSEVRRI